MRQSLFSAQDTSLETTAAHVTLWLERGECVSLKAGRPFQLECSEGEAWVTVEGDARDYRLTPRAGVSIPGGARVVAQALADSRIAIQSQRQI
ncbi:hypothetical protein CCAX7_001920 [Capsulimonas corticalis]|uniref:Uncharacterized protein n=1 Tax=Capsulimonas corticalis TaxID=2219043 RepID=A0A402CRV2_9BACT|nr:hypothetical protein CCAX7_001920 [Capsulimonas corticalis]